MPTVMQESATQSLAVCAAASATVKRLTRGPTRKQLRNIDLEAQAARLCLPQMEELSRNHPMWMAHYDDVDPDRADLGELLDLLRTAPNTFAQGLIYGKLTLRSQLAAVTGRRF